MMGMYFYYSQFNDIGFNVFSEILTFCTGNTYWNKCESRHV